MSVTKTFELTKLENLPWGGTTANVALASQSNGGYFMTGLRPYGTPNDRLNFVSVDQAGGLQNAFGVSPGSDPSAVQLSNGEILVVHNAAIGDSMNFEEVYFDTGTANWLGPYLLRFSDNLTLDTGLSRPDVAAIRPSSVTASDAGFIIVAEDYYSATDSDISLRVFNLSGTMERYDAVSTSSAQDTRAKVVQLDNGNIAVTWERVDSGASTTKMMFALYNRDLSAVIKLPTILDDIGGRNAGAVVVATDGGFDVIYEENFGPMLDYTNRIKLVSLDATGAVLGSRVLVSSHGASPTDYFNLAAERMANGFLGVSYTTRAAFGDRDVNVIVTGQRYDSPLITTAHNLLGGAVVMHEADNSALAILTNGDIVGYYSDLSGVITFGERLGLRQVFTGDGANDLMQASVQRDLFRGHGGIDKVDYAGSVSAVSVNLATHLGSGGWAAGDLLFSIENLTGSAFRDVLTGDAGNNRLQGGAGSDTLQGAAGDDTLIGQRGEDVLRGGSGNDRLNGGDGFDTLFGGTGADTLTGGNGDDDLIGGAGADVMTGGAGADDFIFTRVGHIKGDRINGFTHGVDDLDFHHLLKGSGDFIGSKAFSGAAHELRYDISSGHLMGDMNGDGHADWTLTLTNKTVLTAGDIIF